MLDGTGHYYQVTVDGGNFGGLGTPAVPVAATSGSSTTIVKSGLLGQLTHSLVLHWNYHWLVLGRANTAHYSQHSGHDYVRAGFVTRYPIPIVSPDATSTFIVEPNWGTQFHCVGSLG